MAEQNHKQIQYALYQSSKMASLGLMSASIVHELKNPLTAVIGYAEILQSRQKSGVDNGVVADKMLGAAQRMRSVIDHLRSYCREDKDSDWDKLDPNGPVMSALNFLLHVAKREEVTYDLALESNLPSIKGNGSMLESVFQNLVTNSMDAFSEGKREGQRKISVRSYLENDQIVIVYEDNAGGMSDEVRAKIFEAFFTTKPVGKGTGLGMSITRDIIKEHGGTITVASEINKGTRFEIRLPVPQSASQPSIQAA
jgi:signal transduction histidine kinase